MNKTIKRYTNNIMIPEVISIQNVTNKIKTGTIAILIILLNNNLFRKTTMQTLRVAMLSTFALDFFTTLSIAVLAVFLGLRLIDQQMSLFYGLSILILAPEYFLPIRNFAFIWNIRRIKRNVVS